MRWSFLAFVFPIPFCIMTDTGVRFQILGLGVTTCVLLAVDRHGWDMHVWDLTLDKVIAGRQVSFAAQGLFILGTCFAKVSILVSYLRLAPAQSWFRRITWRCCLPPAPL
jgi:hypothetical protein